MGENNAEESVYQMDIKQLIGEATEYDKKAELEENVLKVGVRVLVYLQME